MFLFVIKLMVRKDEFILLIQELRLIGFTPELKFSEILQSIPFIVTFFTEILLEFEFFT